MVLCTHCQDDALCIQDQDTRMTICCGCGKVVADTIYDEGVRFIQDANGNSRMDAERISSIHSGLSISRERTINKGKYEIEQFVRNLCVSGGDTIVNIACRYYELAVDHKFTRGRRTTHVAAAYLYIACRQSDKPYLLIDFSEYLQISVYALGAVFLQLCQVLLLPAHPIFQKLIDPTLFIQRFTECLGVKRDKAKAVSNTAIQIVASMKRDWMQTGRKPSGICGAALYIAALSHGLDYTKVDVVAVVHVCEATLTKRLIEFENTDSGALMMEEFEKADDFVKAPVSKHSPKSGEILCKDKDKCADYFAHGLCEECYDEFTKLSGGLEGGADPPAFQRAERKRIDTAKRAEEAGAINEAAPRKSFCDTPVSVIENIIRTPRKKIVSDSILSKDPEDGGENFWDELDPESLSDIDDEEVEEYLHNKEERQYKKVIWEEINKEYLEEQAAKEALAAELAARDVVAEEVKKKKRRRSEDTKGSTPATPAEATRNMLKRKRPGSKINVEAVDRLYNRKDDNGDAHEKHKMDIDGEFAEDNGDGETFDHDYDYDDDNRDGYGYDGSGVDNDFDPFDFL